MTIVNGTYNRHTLHSIFAGSMFVRSFSAVSSPLFLSSLCLLHDLLLLQPVASDLVTDVTSQLGPSLSPLSQVPESGAVPGARRLVHLALEVVVAELGVALQLDLHREVLQTHKRTEGYIVFKLL